MNREQLVKEIQKQTPELSCMAIGRALKAYEKVIAEQLRAGNEVRLADFGVFKLSARKARNGRNPQTGATLLIPASTVAKFKPYAALNDSVAK